MPKLIELTVEIEIQRVSCPGVWLCQDGRVSLTVYALGTSYQTCLLPPLFPLLFKDIFYFRRRFQQSCALNNICCMMKNESLYCELMQWSEDCSAGDCVILAQYLGPLNDVLFPPAMCCNDGVDLLMRRSKDFPGILSPKIEVATKIRIDEVWSKAPHGPIKQACGCLPEEKIRHKPVCHTTPYHRSKCSSQVPRSASRSRSQSRSGASKSCCSLEPKEPEVDCDCPSPEREENVRAPCGRRHRPCPEYNVYNVKVDEAAWVNNVSKSDDDDSRNYDTDQFTTPNEDLLKKRIIESKFIQEKEVEPPRRKTLMYHKVAPCVCEICKRYHELFHTAK